jgi:hypothetical protein
MYNHISLTSHSRESPAPGAAGALACANSTGQQEKKTDMGEVAPQEAKKLSSSR